MNLQFRLLTVLVVPLTANCTNAALPPLSPQQLHHTANLIVVGSVTSVKVTTNGKGNHTDWIVEIGADVASVEKGRPEDATQTLGITCWSLRNRPRGWAGPSGHYSIPAKAARFRMWLTKNKKGHWEPLEPNGIQLLDGHKRLDFEHPDTVSAPVKPPLPAPAEVYEATTGQRLFRRGQAWTLQEKAGKTATYQETGRDLSSIHILNETTGHTIRIPRLAGRLQTLNENGSWEESTSVRRSVPPLPDDRKFPEAFRVAPAAAPAANVASAPPLPPDPSSVEESLGFVRVGSTWEWLDLSHNAVNARYTEQYRDDELIQLNLIVERRGQSPHTLTILHSKTGASVVLPAGDNEFKRIQLVPAD